MYQNSTQKHQDEYCRVMEKDISYRHLNPRKETLALIMQFARVYHVEQKLPVRFSGIILN